MTEQSPIVPFLGVEGRKGKTKITAIVDFASFDKAMEFNNLIVNFLLKEMKEPDAPADADGENVRTAKED